MWALFFHQINALIQIVGFFFNVSGLSFLMVWFRLRDKKTCISAKLFEFDSIFYICWFFKSWLMQKFLAHHKMCKLSQSLKNFGQKKVHITFDSKSAENSKISIFSKKLPTTVHFLLLCTFLLIFYIFWVFYAKYGTQSFFHLRAH